VKDLRSFETSETIWVKRWHNGPEDDPNAHCRLFLNPVTESHSQTAEFTSTFFTLF
jgi:hypothetical protein